MRRPLQFITVLGLSVLAVLASSAPLNAQQQSIASTVGSLNGSGIVGTMNLIDAGSGMTGVEVRVNGAGLGPLPIHIHDGTCADLNPVPKIPLTNVVAGTSDTEVGVTMAQLMAQPHAIFMHRSPEEIAVFVACADIQSPATRAATIPATGEADQWLALAPWLAGLGAGLLALGLGLRRAIRRTPA